VWLRLTPGSATATATRQHRGNAQQARHLAHRARAALAEVARYKLELVGLHMHIGSGVELPASAGGLPRE